jgi:hypothetical protein
MSQKEGFSNLALLDGFGKSHSPNTLKVCELDSSDEANGIGTP